MTVYINHRTQQWPVGHGFLHTASLKPDEGAEGGVRTYRYVYDCGSVARTLVEERIDQYFANEELERREPELDMLVLSHFHIDHINGLPHLLSRFKVSKLVLPFLSEDFTLAALADLAASGLDAWNEYSGLVLDPQRWMGARGQGDVQITRVQPANPDDLDRPEDPNGQDPRPNNVSGGDIALPRGAISDKVNGTIGATGHEFWDFRFYAHENWERYLSLLSALEVAFAPPTEADLLAWLSDPTWIAANHATVTDVFRSLGSPNQNGITLCMYSGPRLGRRVQGILRWPSHEQAMLSHVNDFGYRWRFRTVGWLGTGDAELHDAPLFDAFAAHYRGYTDAVHTITIPHHGSIENYCGALGEIGHCAVLTSDHEDDPNGHHPNSLVMVNLKTKSGPAFIVTREMNSAAFSTAEIVVD